jgi:hypothetical protein
MAISIDPYSGRFFKATYNILIIQTATLIDEPATLFAHLFESL